MLAVECQQLMNDVGFSQAFFELMQFDEIEIFSTRKREISEMHLACGHFDIWETRATGDDPGHSVSHPNSKGRSYARAAGHACSIYSLFINGEALMRIEP